MARDPIKPREPDPQKDAEQRLQQFLDSERAGAIMEEEVFGDEGEIEGLRFLEGPRAQEQFALGQPNAPLLLDAEIRLPANVTPEQFTREVGPVIERIAREGMAQDIEDDYDEFVYIPLALETWKEKQRKELEKPKTPLYGSGELVRKMKPGGWATEMKQQGNELLISWGPTTAEDQNPSQKYRDMFFGNPGTGWRHRTKIPRRFPFISDHTQVLIEQTIQQWLQAHTAPAMTPLLPGPTSVNAPGSIWSVNPQPIGYATVENIQEGPLWTY